MATLTIRGLDDEVRERLRARAAEHGRSMEAEVREILTVTVTTPSPVERGLGSWLVAELDGIGDEVPGVFDVRRDDRPRVVDLEA
ncbi:Arc family DNA-binding protein [Cellulosimicrobium terreum]|nr:Arc family DNA-binding protein [Cellulosimicrobium terreum]